MSVLAPSQRTATANTVARRPSAGDAEGDLKRLLIGEELEILRQLEDRADELWDRVGTDPALRATVTDQIVDVLRDAGVKDHDRLAEVLAPLLVATLREEIKNSKDMMVDALYPITGRLVSAGIRVAMQEMLQSLEQQIEQKLSVKRWRIKLQALVTRQSEAELLIGATARFSISRVLLIHRPTGLLIAEASATNDDEDDADKPSDGDLVGGMLSAIMSFAQDAFDPDARGDLKSLAFGASRIYVESSPALLMATVADGQEPRGFTRRLDAAFLDFLEKWGDELRGFEGSLEPETEKSIRVELGQFFDRIVATAAPQKKQKKGLGQRLRWAAIPLGLLVFGWSAAHETDPLNHHAQTAQAAVTGIPALSGYPVSIIPDRQHNRLAIKALAPDAKTREALKQTIARAIGPVDRLESIGIVPSATEKVIERTERRVIVKEKTVPVRKPTPTPIALLSAWIEKNALFFDGTKKFADPERADRKLNALVTLLNNADDRVSLRVIGHADGTGSRRAKLNAARTRAEAVIDALKKRGVPRRRLVLVNASDRAPLTQDKSQVRLNRRVDFSIIRIRRP